MNHFSTETREGVSYITIEGSATIDTAGSIHHCFLEAYQNGLPAVLQIDKITECDSSFIQLTASLCRTLSNQGGSLRFKDDSLPPPVKTVVDVLGYPLRTQCEKASGNSCFLAEPGPEKQEVAQ